MLNGPEARLPNRSFFHPTSPALQRHTRDLADLIVHTHERAKRVGAEIKHEFRENQLRLQLDDAVQKPDRAFQLVYKYKPYNFLMELDEGTEPVRSTKERESLEQKIRFYEAYQDQYEQRFRVLVIFKHAGPRLDRFLELAAELATRQRCLFSAVLLADYLGHRDPLRAPLFVDHHFQMQPLLPGVFQPITTTRPKKLAEPLPVW